MSIVKEIIRYRRRQLKIRNHDRTRNTRRALLVEESPAAEDLQEQEYREKEDHEREV